MHCSSAFADACGGCFVGVKNIFFICVMRASQIPFTIVKDFEQKRRHYEKRKVLSQKIPLARLCTFGYLFCFSRGGILKC
jgi:hypothetical protein